MNRDIIQMIAASLPSLRSSLTPYLLSCLIFHLHGLDDLSGGAFEIVDVVGEGGGEAQAGGAGRHCWRADGGYGFPEMLQQK